MADTIVVGNELYRKLLRRWNTLNWLDSRTPRQDVEMERIDAQLVAAELRGRGLRAMVDDYDEALKNANSLGVVEL